MELDDLRTFVEVAVARGVSPASRRLGVAKSVVSRRLLKLEEELGVQLIARTTRGATLTEVGKMFCEHAMRVCAEMDAIRDELHPTGDIRGLLRIAAPASFGPVDLAPVLTRIAHRYPHLQIHTRYGDSYVDLVQDGFDCAIRVGYLPSSNLVARRIADFPVRLYASPAYVRAHGQPETPEEIAAHPAVMVGTEAWKCSDGRRSVTIHARGRIKADNAHALAEAIAAGLGIGALGEPIAEPYVHDGRLVAIMTAYELPPVGMFVVRPPGEHVPRKVSALTEALVEHFGGTARVPQTRTSRCGIAG